MLTKKKRKVMNKLVFPFIRTSLIFLIYFLVSLNESNGQNEINNFYLSNPNEVVMFEHCDSTNCYYDTITYDERGIIKSVTSRNKQTNAIVREEFICVQFQTHYIIASNEENQKLTAFCYDNSDIYKGSILFNQCKSSRDRLLESEKMLKVTIEDEIKKSPSNYMKEYVVLSLNNKRGQTFDAYSKSFNTVFLEKNILPEKLILTSKDFVNRELKETQTSLILVSLVSHKNVKESNKIKFIEIFIKGDYWQKEKVILNTEQIIVRVSDFVKLSNYNEYIGGYERDGEMNFGEISYKIENNDYKQKKEIIVVEDKELKYNYSPILRYEKDYSIFAFCRLEIPDLNNYSHNPDDITVTRNCLTIKRQNEFKTLKTVTTENSNWKFENLQKAKNLFYITTTLIHIDNG